MKPRVLTFTGLPVVGAVAALLTTSTLAQAHSGHGVTDALHSHPTEAGIMLAILLALLVAAGWWWHGRK